jgi:predicted nuclease with RNAse H fold
MRYCGVVGAGYHQVLCALEEVLAPEPPVRLAATFFEPGSVEDVAAEIRSGGDAVAAIAAPIRRPLGDRKLRVCDEELRRRGVFPLPFEESGRRMFQALANRGLYSPAHEDGVSAGLVEEGAFHDCPVFETHPDGVFCALQGRRLPAKRHPLGIQRRIEELLEDHVLDEDGELWYRRIEEIEAAAAALAAHRFALGHACWVGDPDEAVIVLPGSRLPEAFTGEGVIPPVPRAPLGVGREGLA